MCAPGGQYFALFLVAPQAHLARPKEDTLSPDPNMVEPILTESKTRHVPSTQEERWAHSKYWNQGGKVEDQVWDKDSSYNIKSLQSSPLPSCG